MCRLWASHGYIPSIMLCRTTQQLPSMRQWRCCTATAPRRWTLLTEGATSGDAMPIVMHITMQITIKGFNVHAPAVMFQISYEKHSWSYQVTLYYFRYPIIRSLLSTGGRQNLVQRTSDASSPGGGGRDVGGPKGSTSSSPGGGGRDVGGPRGSTSSSPGGGGRDVGGPKGSTSSSRPPSSPLSSSKTPPHNASSHAMSRRPASAPCAVGGGVGAQAPITLSLDHLPDSSRGGARP